MISLNPMVPPALPTAEALTSAMTLLAIAADPAGTRARLDELTEQMKAVHAAIAELAAAQKSAEDAQAALADLHEQQKKIATDQEVIAEAHAQLAVATAAVSGREQKVGAAEVAIAKARDEIAAREAKLTAKLASYRQALA